ncbi:MAG: hypothetical protein WCO89_01105 [Syntrophus sp. (in: bacteria)]
MTEGRVGKKNDREEKREWVSPTIRDWDVVEETQAGVNSNNDGTGYS